PSVHRLRRPWFPWRWSVRDPLTLVLSQLAFHFARRRVRLRLLARVLQKNCCFQPRRYPGPRFSFVLLSFSLVLFYFFFYFVSLFGLFAFNSSPQTDPGGGNVSR